MSDQVGLDGRARDEDGRIRKKNGDTLVGTLRKIYGDHFAEGARADMKLNTVLDRTGFDSLTQYEKAGMPKVPRKK